MLIPKLIHLTTNNPSNLRPELMDNIQFISQLNPHWKTILYSEMDRLDFIKTNFESKIFQSYLKINPRYGVARADFFRYLVIHKIGGLYLDIKSTATKPLDSVIGPNDTFITSRWPKEIDGVDTSKMGFHAKFDLDEYQNWFVLASPSNPVLAQVIDDVVTNIEKYSAFRDGVGRKGVLRITGPIAFTLAVQPFESQGVITIKSNAELGFQYSIYKFGTTEHHSGSTKHYSLLTVPLIESSKIWSFAISNYFSLQTLFSKLLRKLKILW